MLLTTVISKPKGNNAKRLLCQVGILGLDKGIISKSLAKDYGDPLTW